MFPSKSVDISGEYYSSIDRSSGADFKMMPAPSIQLVTEEL